MTNSAHDPRRFAPHFFFVLALACFWMASRPLAMPEVESVAAVEAKRMIEAGALVVDVRPNALAGASHLSGALLIPLDVLAANLQRLGSDRTRPVVVYCRDGARSGPEGTAILREAGFSGAVNLVRGIEGWRAAGYSTRGA